LIVESRVLGKLTLPLGHVSVIYLDRDISARAAEARCQELKLVSPDYDMIVVEDKEGNWLGLECVFKGLDEDKVHISYQDEDRSVDRKKVRVLRLVASERPSKTLGTATAADGSDLAFSDISIDDRSVSLTSPAMGKVKIGRLNLASVELASDRVTHLSALAPSEKIEEGFFDQTYPHRTNQAVSGNPMKLDGKTYRSGLGLHSFSQLSWDLAGEYRKFVANVGIDDVVRPRGDVTLEILVDGKVVEKMAVKGSEQARIVRVDLAGAKTLMIRVDYGSDQLDAADHLNLANARLIK
jgi:hypothetical protein